MKFELKGYQDAAATKVLAGLRNGSREYVEGREFTAVSLSAPTGAGKTVIAAAVIEQILYGDTDGVYEADPEAVFLWLTDDPSLNEQTRKKILEASDQIQSSHLVTVDDSFNQPELDQGKVYFLNIQKLGKHSNLTKKSDKRPYTIWTTLANTVKNNGAHYYLVIDEAHRGAGSKLKDRQTLAQRLISDAEGVVPPAPVVWGISATPDRFDRAMTASTPARVSRTVKVPVSEVRESGLIKDVLSIHHQGERQQMETTLIRAAVRSLKDFDAEWEAYTVAEDEPSVRPILVVQIPPKYSSNAIADLLLACTDEWDELNGKAIAHSLENHTTQEYGSYAVRYVAPQDIEDKPAVRLVLFKEALTTGWDCPRAEVMLSLRPAKDDTYIAQLIGRMVRAPLARRIVSNEALNRVRLFLPKFDTDAVLAVKDMLEADPEGPPTTITIDSVDAYKNAGVEPNVFAVFAGIASYVVPGPVHRSQVARLHKLAALLIGDALLDNALKEADDYLISVLAAERARLDASGVLVPLITDVETTVIAIAHIQLYGEHGGEGVVTEEMGVNSDIGDIDRIFRSAAGQFRDGLAHQYWAYRVTDEGDDSYDAKVLTIALSMEPSVVQKVEDEAESRVKRWLSDYGAKIAALSEDQKAKYAEVRAMAQAPEEVNPALPSVITMAKGDPAWTKHLYSDADGVFNAKLGRWEEHVLQLEQAKDSFVGWYRNPTGGERALRIPFEESGAWKPMYPDFIVFHRGDDGAIRPSILDPHGHHFADTGPKWRGLATYAAKHGGEVARIEAIIKDANDQYVFLDLKDATIRGALDGANTKDDIAAVFTDYGGICG